MIGAIAQFVGTIWVYSIQQFAEHARPPEPPESWKLPDEGLQIPRRLAGEPIPVVFGTVWIDEPHVFWVTDARAQTMRIGSGEGSNVNASAGFTRKRRFTAGLGMVLCQGPLDTVSQIRIADRVLAGSADLVTDGALLDLSAGPDEFAVWSPHLHGATSGDAPHFDDGVAGRIGVAPGLTTQSGLVVPRWGSSLGDLRGVSVAWMRGPGPNHDWSIPAGTYPPVQILIRNDGSAYDDPYAFYLASQPELRPWRFLVTRTVGRGAGITQWYAAKADVAVAYDLAGQRTIDMNPAHILVELLCDPFWGIDLGDPEDVIDETSFQAMADTWEAGGGALAVGLSWVWDRESKVADIVREIERIGDVVLEHEPADGLWYLRSWTSAVTPVEIDDDDIVGTPNIAVVSPDELPTTIHVTWQDRRRDREQTYVLQDLAALHIRGREIVHWWRVPMVASPVLVPQLARRELQRLAYPRVRVELEVFREVAASLRKTDPVELTSTEYGISGQFRVLEWSHGQRADGTVRLTLISDPTADVSTPIWHEPDDPEEPEPEALPGVDSYVEEMPLHVWWSMEPGVADLPDRLWAYPRPTADQITRLWMWAPRPTDRWDLDGWRWADRILDENGDPGGFIAVSPEVSPFTPYLTVTELDRGNDRLGEDTIEHDGSRVLRVGDILAIPLVDETPIVELDSSGLSLADRGNLAARNYDYSQMDGGYEFAVVTEVVDTTHVKILGGLWDTLPARQIGGTSFVVGHYPAVLPWDSAPDALLVSGAGQVRRAPVALTAAGGSIRNAVQTAALDVAGARLLAFDDAEINAVPLSGADSPAGENPEALTRGVRPLVGGAIELFEIEDGANSRVTVTVEPRTKDSPMWAPSSLALSSILDHVQLECCLWPSDPPPLILWVIDPSSGDVIATRGWTESFSSGELAFLNSDEEAIHDAIHGGEQLFDDLILIVTAEGAMIETPESPLKSLQSYHYLRFDLDRTIVEASGGTAAATSQAQSKYYPASYEAYYEAADLSSLAVNDDGSGGTPSLAGTIGRWLDQGGDTTADGRQATAGLRPVRSTVGGRPSVLFADDLLDCLNTGWMNNKPAAVIMAVGTLTATYTAGTAQQIVYNTSWTPTAFAATLDIDGAGSTHRMAGRKISTNSLATAAGENAVLDQSFGRIGINDYAGAAISHWHDGVEHVGTPTWTAGNSAAAALNSIGIGNWYDSGFRRHWRGHLERIVIKDVVPDAQEIRLFNASWLLFHTS